MIMKKRLNPEAKASRLYSSQNGQYFLALEVRYRQLVVQNIRLPLPEIGNLRHLPFPRLAGLLENYAFE